MSEENYYQANHEVTENYKAGMLATKEGKLEESIALLLKEPSDSPCYGLALANVALAQCRLDRYVDAIATGNRALEQFTDPGCPHPPTLVQALRTIADATAQQGRHLESLPLYEEVCQVGAELAKEQPQHASAINLERAHAFGSLGANLLKADKANEAVEASESARKLYREYPNNFTGRAEVLTNLAHAYLHLGDQVKAKFALEEALQVVQGDPDQTFRIRMAQAQAGLISTEEAKVLFNEAGAEAVREGRFDTAHLRYCIAAKLAHDIRDPAWGLDVVQKAAQIESKLGAHNLNEARLQFYKARFYEMERKPPQEILKVLQEGARMWCERLPGQLELTDYQQAISVMHNHFCWLAQLLLDDQRTEEAFMVFEVGRARSFAVELNGNYDHELVTVNPFEAATINCALLGRLKAGLGKREVVITVAALRGELVTFVVGRDTVEVSRIPLSTRDEIIAFNEKLGKLIEGLRQGTGTNALPPQLSQLGQSIAGILGGRTVVLFSPHEVLHLVPWRCVLRQAGIPWKQLCFSIQFSPFLDPDTPSPKTLAPPDTIALGFGATAKGVSLEDEAAEFANVFGAKGKFVGEARSTDVQNALSSNATVLLSCHGIVHPTERFLLLSFDLKDGAFRIKEMIPKTVQSPLVILSACSSGVYEMAKGDYPVGAVPTLLLAGAKVCICARFPISAHFSKAFFLHLAKLLSQGVAINEAFSQTCEEMEKQGQDLWRHIACVEVASRGR
jgi:tetratricopeptide (TPR) repeat protein